MRKIYYSLLLCAATVCAGCQCEFDDTGLWNAIDDVTSRVDALESAAGRINSEMEALSAIVNALQNNIGITEVRPTADGYEIMFSDGKSVDIRHGKDGAAGQNGQNGKDGKDGVNTPEISLRPDEDGNYYWTLGGDWLVVDGERVRANGIDGKDGAAGKDGQDGAPGANSGDAPQVRINPDTGEWEISVNGGQTWSSTGVSAIGEAGAPGDSIFRSIDTDSDEYVLFVMTDGSEFRVPRHNPSMPVFTVEGADGVQVIKSGMTKRFKVVSDNVAGVSIQKPDGWRADFSDGVLAVTAPVAENIYAEEAGTVSIVAVSADNRSLITEFAVSIYELRILTFEDEDARFRRYEMPIGSETFSISTWSDLIDGQQYGGPMLYGDEDDYYMNEEPYFWYDQNNTELKHSFPEMYGYYCFWSGGHAISNYADTDIDGTGDAFHQLTIFGEQGSAGHNGSANFAVHFGYIDPSSSFNMTQNLPALEFGDSEARIIDHMWVMPNNYALYCYTYGNGLTSQLGDDDYVKITATGYGASDVETGKAEIVLAHGKEFIREWTRWDLSALGKVLRVEFNILGSSDNGYGFSQPAYFAYDDVAVRFY